MKFSEKIDKLLIYNEKDLHSIGDLERHLELGLHTIRAAIKKEEKENKEPTKALQVKIIEGLGVRREWWDTQKGEIFLKKGTSVTKDDVPELTGETKEIYQKMFKVLLDDVKRLEDELAAMRGKQKPE